MVMRRAAISLAAILLLPPAAGAEAALEDTYVNAHVPWHGVTYSAHDLEYRTFDAAAIEVLRLNFKPQRVIAGQAALHEPGDIHLGE